MSVQISKDVSTEINNHLPRRRDLGSKTKSREHLVTVQTEQNKLDATEGESLYKKSNRLQRYSDRICIILHYSSNLKL